MSILPAPKQKRNVEVIVLAADLAGTFIFAVQGAEAAIRGGLDLLGVMVISFAAALGGGVIRDLLIGATPPNAIRDWRYPALSFAAGLLTFLFHASMHGLDSPLLVALDAAGLSLFAVAGVEKATLFGIGPFVAALMGTITGVGWRGDPRHPDGPRPGGAASGHLCERGVRGRGRRARVAACGFVECHGGLRRRRGMFRASHDRGIARLALAEGIGLVTGIGRVRSAVQHLRFFDQLCLPPNKA
jgi:hypothetical protein